MEQHTARQLRSRSGIAALIAVTFALTMGGTAGAAPVASSEDEYIERADDICEKAQQKLLKKKDKDNVGFILYAGNAVSFDETKDIVAFSGQIGATMDGVVKKLRKLPPPKGDKAVVAEILDALSATAAGYRDAVDLTSAGESKRAEASDALQQANDDAANARRLAEDYGLEVCGEFGPNDPRGYDVVIAGEGVVPHECAVVTLSDEGLPDTYEGASCDEPHNAEAFAVVEHAYGPEPYPAQELELHMVGDLVCGVAFNSYVGTDIGESEFDYTDGVPTPDTWADGDRGVVCILFTDDAHMFTGAVENADA